MKKAVWLAMALAGLCATIPFSTAMAQDEGRGAASPARVEAPSPAPGLAVTGTNQPPAKEESLGIVSVILRSGPFGVLIWVLLLVASVISVALIVDSYVTIREKKISPVSLVQSVRTAMEQGDLVKAVQHCENEPGPLASILQAGFSNVEEGFEVVQDSVGIAADIESEKLLSRVAYLSVISNTTPMLGLIGTVQGMIRAFLAIGTNQAGAAQQAVLALNISHGLWATAVGLATAVPATIFFYFFKNRATRIILGMEALTLDVIKTLRNVEVVQE